MSNLQVDSISSMGGGHVDGAGKVVQCVYHEWDDITETTASSFSPVAGSKISFTPKFADSLLVIIYDFYLTVVWVSGYQEVGAAAQISHNGTVFQPAPPLTRFEMYTNASATSSSGSNLFARQVKINSIAAGSTSARDIELQFAVRHDNGNLGAINRNSHHSHLLVQEIAQ